MKTETYKRNDGSEGTNYTPEVQTGCLILGGWIIDTVFKQVWGLWVGIIIGILILSSNNETFIYKLLHNKVSKEQTNKPNKKKDKKFEKESRFETWE